MFFQILAGLGRFGPEFLRVMVNVVRLGDGGMGDEQAVLVHKFTITLILGAKRQSCDQKP